MKNQPTIISLFAGAGGLDLGFSEAGFRTVWANEFDRSIWGTFEANFPDAQLDRRSISDIRLDEIPSADGIIGGPPCQSWSNAGAKRGLDDQRGQMFFSFIETIRVKQPLFFLCENVAGIVSRRNITVFNQFIRMFEHAGYCVSWELLNTHDYGIPQTRKRVVIVGYRKDLGKRFVFPRPTGERRSLKDAIGDLPIAMPARVKNRANIDLVIPNHEYYLGGYSSRFMMTNRRRTWEQPSFTIVASAGSEPLHPDSPPMRQIRRMDWRFAAGRESEYRRLSVRECARIQTFPDNFSFIYKSVVAGYKMIGNAVPVQLANILATQIYSDLYSR